jgi:hypothetical protein
MIGDYSIARFTGVITKIISDGTEFEFFFVIFFFILHIFIYRGYIAQEIIQNKEFDF